MLQISDEITWRNHLAELIWNALPYFSLKVRTRDQFNFRCPLCGDSKKSLTKKRGFYYISSASYHCFNCEEHISGMALLKRIAPENVYHDAVSEFKNMKLNSLGKSGDFPGEDTVDLNGLVVCRPIPAWKILCDNLGWNTPTAPTKEALDYLKGRGMDGAMLRKFLSIESPKGTPYILIPYKYDGDCIFYQLHNYTKAETEPGRVIKYIYPNSIELNDQEKPVFNIDSVDPSWKYIIGCEGVYDALSYRNGVAFGGRSITDYQWKMLKTRWPHHTLVAAFDNDEAGRNSMKKLCAKGGDIRFLNIYPLFEKFNVKDANEFIQLGKRAKNLLLDKNFLEKSMMTQLEMKVKLLVG